MNKKREITNNKINKKREIYIDNKLFIYYNKKRRSECKEKYIKKF